MGLIKKYRLEEKGEITLKDSRIEYKEQEPIPYFNESPAQNLEDQKQNSFEEDIQGVESRGLSEIETQAKEMLETAQYESEEIRRKAYAEGLERGQKESENKIKEALSTLNEAVVERKKIIKDAESEILRLALKAAEQIIRSEVSLHRDVCLNIVSDAISRVSDREQVLIRVNKEDAEYIKRYKDKLAGIVDGVKSFSVLEDSQIEPGGCIIETNLGYVDARISTKIHSIEEALKKMTDEESRK